jgi:co-chaperonin GroES (HSP10)
MIPKKYQLTTDFYLVLLDEIWESGKTQSGIITSNTNIIHEEQEDRGEFKRRYGTVLEVPLSFSDAHVDTIDPGLPTPKAYVGHEWIQKMRNAGYEGYDSNAKYYPSTYPHHQTITKKDYAKKVDVKVGDLIYFRDVATDVERYMGKYNGKHLFSISVDEIHCKIEESPVFAGYNKFKQKRIIAQGGWVLVEINMETWQDITTPSGVIIKVAPEALPLQGKIVAAQREDLVVGSNILFHQDADAPITVEGRKLTVMQEYDILAFIKP